MSNTYNTVDGNIISVDPMNNVSSVTSSVANEYFGGNEVSYDANGNVTGFQYDPGLTENVAVDTITLSGAEADFVSPTSTSSLTSPTLYERDSRLQNSLRYPLKNTNNHFVRFFINIDEESSMITQNTVSFESRPVDYNDQNRTNNASSEVLEKNLKAAGAILGGMTAAAAAKHLFAGKGQAVASGVAGTLGAAAGAAGAFDSISTETLKLTKKLKRLHSSITLYAPPAISTNHYAQYDISEDKLARLANSDMAGAIQNAISNPGTVTRNLGRILAASSNNTVSTLSRTAYNPKKDLLFKAMGNRSFQFEFQFAPSSKEEAKVVRDIIYMFKLFSHPEVLKGYGQFLYLYPAEFDIKYGFYDDNGKEHENTNLNKISSCVLESINVNYGPQGSFQSLEDGEPIMTTMALRFKEIETLTQDRIKQGF
jgi:Tail-tube assembly protein